MSVAQRLLAYARSRFGTTFGYPAYRERRLRTRRHIYATAQEPGLISFLTTVWNTDVAYLRVLADTVARQAGGTHFEWVVLDNGSTRPATRDFVRSLASYPFVRLYRADANLGIIGGMRYCLERATGRYILPLDSDDYLYPDCVNVLTWHIKQYGYPGLLYTDEDKLRDGEFADPYFKPAWDPVLFFHSCYIAHLCAIERARALDLGAYTDARAEGCHDWDTFTRFVLAGEVPRHVPEVLYTWRMHPQSTAGNIESKSYIHESHEAILSKFISAQLDPSLYALELSPLFSGTPDRWFRRKPTNGRPLLTVVLGSHGAAGAEETATAGVLGAVDAAAHIGELAAYARAACTHGALLHLRSSAVRIQGADWMWEVMGLMELFPDTAMVGGRICTTDGLVLSAGCYFGFGRGCETPDRGRRVGDPGYFAQMWKPHSVSAVSPEHAVIDPAFLLDFIETGAPATVAYLGAWLGAHARRAGRRVVYSPFVLATSDGEWDELVSDRERAAFLACNQDLIPEPCLLSPRLGLTAETAYQPVESATRDAQLAALLSRAGIRRIGR